MSPLRLLKQTPFLVCVVLIYVKPGNNSSAGFVFYVLSDQCVCLFRTQNVLGEKGRRIRELTAVVQKRFGFPEGSVEVRRTYQNVNS